MDKIFAAVVIVAGIVFVVVVTLLYGAVAWGYAFSQAWLWLAVPAFGMTPITWQQGAVAALLFRLLRGSGSNGNKSDDDDKRGMDLLVSCLMPWVSLGGAWLVASFLF